MRKEENCKNADCAEYPHYGVAPHICYWRKEGGFENSLGTSEKAPPNNPLYESFVLDLDDGLDPNEDVYAGGTGVYYCPDCKKDMPSNIVKNKFGAYYKNVVTADIAAPLFSKMFKGEAE